MLITKPAIVTFYPALVTPFEHMLQDLLQPLKNLEGISLSLFLIMLIMVVGHIRLVKTQFPQSKDKNLYTEKDDENDKKNDGTINVATTAATAPVTRCDDAGKSAHTNGGEAITMADTANHLTFRNCKCCKEKKDCNAWTT